MSQARLFPPDEIILVDGPLGRVTYRPSFVAAWLAQGWFAALQAGVPWKAEKRRMYDREVDVPRLTAHYHLGPDAAPVPDPIRAAASHVVTGTDVPYNSVGLNFYRDGRDSVAPHNDHLNVLVPGFPIALLSLGSSRRMTIRAKEPPRRVLHVELEPGSLLVMSYETQLHYTHGVPKTTEPVGERISLAFRVKPAPAGAGDASDPYR